MTTRVAVVGLGLIGGSLALRLVRRGLEVEGYDPDPDSRDLAVTRGIVVHDELGEWLAQADLVVLAVPLDVMGESLGAVARLSSGDSLVFDVGSVKAAVHVMAADAGLADRFVGCHPMAGTEKSGFVVATEDLLVAATWAVTLTEQTPASAISTVIRFLATHFDAHIAVLGPASHDRIVSAVSHLPHVLANELLATLGATSNPWAAAAMAAGSFRDGTRVGGRNSVRTANMLAQNHEALVHTLDGTIERLTELRQALGESGPEDLLDRLTVAETVRAAYLRDETTTSTLPADATAEVLVAHGEDGWLIVGVDGESYQLSRGALNAAFRS